VSEGISHCILPGCFYESKEENTAERRQNSDPLLPGAQDLLCRVRRLCSLLCSKMGGGGIYLLLGVDIFRAGVSCQPPLWDTKDLLLEERPLPDSHWRDSLMQSLSLTFPAPHHGEACSERPEGKEGD